LNYSGNFVSAGAGGAAGPGAGGQYSLDPKDLRQGFFFAPRRPYSIGVGPACGVGLAGWASGVEYIPIYTTNPSTGKYQYHLYDYLFDHPREPGDIEGLYNNGFITGLATEDASHYYNRIQKYIQDQGWDRGD